MKQFLRSIDRHDLQLITGIALLGYGLFLVHPPSCFITLGVLLILPSLVPLLASLRGAK